MTREETKMIIKMLEIAYPQHYSKLSQEHIIGQINLWSELWKDDNADMIANAVKVIIATDSSSFPPTIGQINSKAHDMFAPKGMTEQQAWNILYKAICNSGYNSKFEYDRLPEEIQELTSPNQMRDWAIDDKPNWNVTSSNFMRSFKEREKQRKDFDKLPNETKNLISELNNQMKLENKDE